MVEPAYPLNQFEFPTLEVGLGLSFPFWHIKGRVNFKLEGNCGTSFTGPTVLLSQPITLLTCVKL